VRAGVQFAPTYHEYVLYSDGSQEAPQRYRVRTFVPTGGPGQERHSLSSRPLRLAEPGAAGAGAGAWPAMEVGSPDRLPSIQPATAPRPSLTTVGQLVAGLADPRHASASEWSQHLKPPLRGAPASPTALGPNFLSFSDKTNNDFNPRALPNPAALPPDPGSSPAALRFRPWGSRSFEPGSRVGVDSRRESSNSGDDEVTELTKLTDRRASEHGPLMDTIDIGGENEEYSEGFIQR